MPASCSTKTISWATASWYIITGTPPRHCAGAHRPVQARPVVADDGQVVAALEAQLGQAAGNGAHFLATCDQVQVCQMPASRWITGTA
jgi:hypothetical protein